MNVYRMYYIYSWFLLLCPVVMCVCLLIYNKAIRKPKKIKIISNCCFFLALPGQSRYYADKETIVKLKVLYVTNIDEASITYNKDFEITTDGEFFIKYRDAVIYRRKLRKAWRRSVAPESGSFIAYKKVASDDEGYIGDYIAVLQIPEDAKRLTTTTHSNIVNHILPCAAHYAYKCRADKVRVLRIETLSGECRFITAYSKYTQMFAKKGDIISYEIGKTVYADEFDDDPNIDCSHGINFFMQREDAEAYI